LFEQLQDRLALSKGNFMRAVFLASACLALAFSLSGCAVYEIASTAVGVTATVVGTAVDVAGDVVDVAGDMVTAPFPSRDDSKKKAKNN
jgi:hypothetical protein